MKLAVKPCFAIVGVVFALSSCKNSHRHSEEILNFVTSSAASSLILIERENQVAYHELQEKVYDPLTAHKARIWEPKAILVQKQIAKIITDIGRFRGNTNLKGELLWDAVLKFRDSMLLIDSQISKEFASHIKSFPKSYDSLENTSETIIKMRLSNLPPMEVSAFLSSLCMQARILENQLLRFCIAKCPMNAFVFDSYSTIIGLSSSVVGAGEEILITAGVGAFSRKAEPKITVDGKPVGISEDGAAYYKFKAPLVPGKYTTTTIIRFIDQAANEQIIKKDVVYSVVKK
jgi:hypothetical protein